MRRGGLLLAVTALVALAFTAAVQAREPDTLPVLRRKLLEAQGDVRIGEALDLLTAKVGDAAFFADEGAFGDWLATLPDGRADHPLVRVRRGWAYVAAKRGKDAVPLLETALQDNPADGVGRAYLGEALRQVARFAEAAEMLTSAVKCGYYGKHLHDSLVKTLFDSRRASIAGHADELPEYVGFARTYLAVRPDPEIDFIVAQLLLEDFATYEKPERARGRLWAEAAGEHALRSLRTSPTVQDGSAKLAFDAARTLAFLDEERHGATDRYDLLAMAHRFGQDPAGGPPQYPQVLVWLAESAAREGRFELAWRLATRRLEISGSPRARRLLMSLPPDLGGEE